MHTGTPSLRSPAAASMPQVSAERTSRGVIILLKHGEQLSGRWRSRRWQLLPKRLRNVVRRRGAVNRGRGVRLVDRARVVVVTTGETEVEDNRPERPMRLEMAQYLPQVLEGSLCLLPHREAPGLLDNGFILRGTDDARDAAHAGGGVGRQLPS